MNPLPAQIQPAETAAPNDRRRSGRRTIRLDVPASTASADAGIVIQNISRTGLLIEAATPFAVGEVFMVALPEIGATAARVKWQRGSSYGCEFLAPVTSSAVSAALLKNPFADNGDEVEAEIAPSIETAGRPGWIGGRAVSLAVTTLFLLAILAMIFAMASLSLSH